MGEGRDAGARGIRVTAEATHPPGADRSPVERLRTALREGGVREVVARIARRLVPRRSEAPRRYPYPCAPLPRPVSSVSLPEVVTAWLPQTPPSPPLDLSLRAVATVLERCRTDPAMWGLLGAEGVSERQVGETLYALVRWLRPRTIVEVGSYNGATTICLAAACAENRHGHVHALEPFALHADLTERHLGNAGVAAWCTVHRTPSTDIPALRRLGTFDLVFLDADHAYEATRRDFDAFSAQLAPDGVIVMHDCVKFMDVRRVIHEIVERGAFDCLTLATGDGDGIAILRRRRAGSAAARSPGA